MATKSEFKIIKKMYHRAVGKAVIKIENSIKEAKEVHGFENGSALTDVYKEHLDKAMDKVDSVYDVESREVIYNQNDSLKMLEAIDYINTYIL